MNFSSSNNAARIGVLLCGVCLSKVALADNWSSIAYSFAIAYYLLAFYVVQVVVSVAIAVRKLVTAGRKAAGLYLLISMMAMITSVVVIWLATAIPTSLVSVFLAIVVIAPPMCWVLFHRSIRIKGGAN